MGEIEEFEHYWRRRLKGKKDKVVVQRTHTNEKWGGGAKDTFPDIDSRACISPFSTMIIDADGTVALCCINTPPYKAYGDIRRKTISEIWNGEMYESIRERLLYGGRGNCEECKGCDMWE